MSNTKFDNRNTSGPPSIPSPLMGTPYWINYFIPRSQFESILESLQITDVRPPGFFISSGKLGKLLMSGIRI